MKLVWTARAKRELAEIVTHIWSDDPAAAKKIRGRTEHMAGHLKSHPFMGRVGAVSGTREAVPHPSYRIVYELRDDTVFVLSVVHTARLWPPVAEDDI